MRAFGEQRLVVACVVCLLLACRSCALDEKINRAATVAMGQLKQLSQSGIYESLVLDRLIDASSTEGGYFDHVRLKCQVSSPYLEKPEVLEATVMHDKDTGEARSVAFDTFPEFRQDDIELLNKKRVLLKIEQREKLFQSMEQEFVDEEMAIIQSMEKREEKREELMHLRATTLLKITKHKDIDPVTKGIATSILEGRLDKLERSEQGVFSPA